MNESDKEVIFFIICYLIYRFNWSLKKSKEYLKTVTELPNFSIPVENFMVFFEKKLSNHRKIKLNDEWVKKSYEEGEEVVANTFINRYKGISVIEEICEKEIKILDSKKFLKKKISKKKIIKKRISIGNKIKSKILILKQKKLTEIYKTSTSSTILSVKIFI